MRLSDAQEGHVVRNEKNRAHYRFEGPDRDRARIRPLELFPTGLLIPKPTDTLVSQALEVTEIGPWHDGMRVEGQSTRPRAEYEAELIVRREALASLTEQYDALPPGGTGKLSKGSWANKIKNCEYRIEVLVRGLGLDDPGEQEDALSVAVAAVRAAVPRIRKKDVVALPTGAPGVVIGLSRRAGEPWAKVRTVGDDGERTTVPAPCQILMPWAESRIASL